MGMWTSSIGIGLVLNLRAYDFVSQEIRAEDPSLETFHTKNILLNEGMRAWMLSVDQPHENFAGPRGSITCMHLKSKLTFDLQILENFQVFFCSLDFL